MSRFVGFAVIACACAAACAAVPDAHGDGSRTRETSAGASSPTATGLGERDRADPPGTPADAPNDLAATRTVDPGASAPPVETAPTAAPDEGARVLRPAATATPDRRAAPRDLALPYAWDSMPAAAFEQALARWNPDAAPGRLESGALAQLSRALDDDAPRALRAVLLLARSADPAGADALLARLERRIRPSTDVFPAVDVACAAALAEAPDEATDATRARARAAALEELARGRRPHPLLAVRVECAGASLALGRESTVAFLLAILREGTVVQERRPSWTRASTSIDDLAFAQWRASEALSAHAGVANEYRPEASATERAQVAADLERAVAARAEHGGA